MATANIDTATDSQHLQVERCRTLDSTKREPEYIWETVLLIGGRHAGSSSVNWKVRGFIPVEVCHSFQTRDCVICAVIPTNS